MNNSPCTPDEAEGFEHISDFLYPAGVLDSQALGLFLTAYGVNDATSRHAYHYNSSPSQTQKQMHAMGFLLRLLDPSTPLWLESFEHWYAEHRMQHASYIGVWFSFLDEAHKEVTKSSMLKMLAGAPPIDIRVALMMDGMEHYRDLPVQTFIGKSLLRVKSASFVKALKPSVAQMPMVLRMAKELKAAAPEFAELAQAITMGVFVQRMSEKPSDANPQSEYSACEAFLLVLDHGVVPPARLFVSSATSRFKGSSLLPDMVKFVLWALQTDPSRNWLLRAPSDIEKEFATTLVPTLLDEILKQDHSTPNFDAALIKTHAVTRADKELQIKIHDWFNCRLAHIGKTETASLDSGAFVYLLDHMFTPEHHQYMWSMWSNSQRLKNPTDLVAKYVENGQNHYTSERYYELLRQSVTAVEIVSILHRRATAVFDRERVMATYNVPQYQQRSPEEKEKSKEQHFLSQLETFFKSARRLVSDEVRQNESFKQLVAATSMAYLLHGSQSAHVTYNDRNGQFVNLLAEPLPLLRSSYPEHTIALNALRKDIISGMNKKEGTEKNNYHHALYNVLGKALYLKESVSIGTVQSMTDNMGMSVFSYFQACAMQNEVHFEVSSDMFEAGMF